MAGIRVEIRHFSAGGISAGPVGMERLWNLRFGSNSLLDL